MTEAYREEFAELTARAEKYLRHPRLDLPIAVRVTWNRPFDYTRFRDPMKSLEHGLTIEPTVERKEAELSRSELDSRLVTLQTIKIPVVIDRSIAVDGVSFGFESSGRSSVKLEWRSIMPGGWKPIINWAEEMTSFLDATLEAK